MSESSYKDGEVVWVKWGNVWWPGEVWSNSRVPEDIITSLRKPVIAFVKFFQEDSFEFVRSPNNICQYNAEKKMDFIKKGMDKYRSNNKVMTNFPADVVKAEQLTNGNVNILNSLETPTKSKGTSNAASSDSAKKSTQLATVSTPSPVVSNQKKSVGSYNSSVKVQNTTSSTQKSNDKKLTCTMCNFSTDRMNLLMMHIKNHSLTILSRVNSSSSSSLEIRRPVVPKVSSRNKELDDGIAEDVRKIKESMKETSSTPTSSKKTRTPATAKATPKVKQTRQRKDRKLESKDNKVMEEEKPTGSVENNNKKEEEETQDINRPKSATCELKNELLADWLDEEDVKVDDNKRSENPTETSLKTPISVSVEKPIESSPAKTGEKAPAEISRSIRNIPKKQRVSEIYIQPEPEKVEVRNSIKKEVKPTALKQEEVKEELSTPLNSESSKKSQQKASKRKHATSDSSNEPEKKKLSEEVDEKILMATAELLNETEVPKLSNVQSPSTFHTNDIDKRYLPPKERNKRIFRAKNSPETVSHKAPVQITNVAAEKPCDEKISTEYDLKIDDKNDSIPGGVVPINNDEIQLLPTTTLINSNKNDRQELMLPHKKKQSSRLLNADKLSSDSPKAPTVIEPIKQQEQVTTTILKVKKNRKSTDSQKSVEKLTENSTNSTTTTQSPLREIVEIAKDEQTKCSSPARSVPCDSTTSATIIKESVTRGQKRQHSRDSRSDKDIYEFQPESKKLHKSDMPKSIIAHSNEAICITSKGSLAVARRDSIKTTVANSVVVTSQVIITEATRKQPIVSSQSLTLHDMISSSSSQKQQSISSAATTNVAVSPQQTLKNALKIPKENVEEMKKQGLVTIENNKTKLTPKGRQKFIEFQNEKNSLTPTSSSLSTGSSSLSMTTSSSSTLSSTISTSSIDDNDKESEPQVEQSNSDSQDETATMRIDEKEEPEEAQKSNSMKIEQENNEKDVELKELIEIDDEKAELESKCVAEKSNESEIEQSDIKTAESDEEVQVDETQINNNNHNNNGESVKEDDLERATEKSNEGDSQESMTNNVDVTKTSSEEFEKSSSTKETESDNSKTLDSPEFDEPQSQESTTKSTSVEEGEEKDDEDSQTEKLVIENGKDEEEMDEISKDDEEKESDTTELSQDSGSTGFIALQAENFGGPPNCFYLCRQIEDRYEPVDNQILVLNAQNALVPYDGVIADLGSAETVQENLSAFSQLSPNSNIIINTPNGQKIELSHHMILALHEQADENGLASIESAGETMELNINAILEAIAAQDVQEANEPSAVLLDNSDVPLIIESEMPLLDIHHPSVATQVSETLSKPIMSTTIAPEIAINPSKPTISENASRMLNIEDSLATIGVTTQQRDVPKSLELPITVTNPKIAETVNHRKLAASLGTTDIESFVVQADNGSDD